MTGKNTGLVVGKDFRPPDGAESLDWCYLTVDLSNDERIAVRVARDQVSRADVGDVVKLKLPKKGHAVRNVVRLGTDPTLLPPVRRSG